MNLMIKNNVRCVVNTEIIDAMKYPIIKIIATRLRPKRLKSDRIKLPECETNHCKDNVSCISEVDVPKSC